MNICWIKINYIFVRRIKWPEVHFMHNRKDCQLLSRRSSLLDWPHVGFVLFCLGVLGFGFSFFLIVCMLTVYFLEGEGCNYFHWSALKQNNANIILTTILIFKVVYMHFRLSKLKFHTIRSSNCQNSVSFRSLGGPQITLRSPLNFLYDFSAIII